MDYISQHALGTSVFSGVPGVGAVGLQTLGQRQRAAEQQYVSVAGQSAEVAEEPAGQRTSRVRTGPPRTGRNHPHIRIRLP